MGHRAPNWPSRDRYPRRAIRRSLLSSSCGRCTATLTAYSEHGAQSILPAAEIGLAEHLGALYRRLRGLHRMGLRDLFQALLVMGLYLVLGVEPGSRVIDLLRIDAEGLVKVDDTKWIGQSSRLGAGREIAADLECALHAGCLGAELRESNHVDVADLQRDAVQRLRQRTEQVAALHDAEGALDQGVGKLGFPQADAGTEALQFLALALGDFQGIARLYAFHLRDRHEDVDEKAAIDASGDLLDVLHQPGEIGLDLIEGPETFSPIGRVDEGQVTGKDRTRLDLHGGIG